MRIQQCIVVKYCGGGYSYISFNSILQNVRIARYCSIGHNVQIGLARHDPSWVVMSHLFHFTSLSSYQFNHNIVSAIDLNDSMPSLCDIESGVWIGANVLIPASMPLKIGRGAIIAAGSVVTKDIPPYAIVAGNPARIKKMRFSDELCSDIDSTQWWEYDLNEAALHIKDFQRHVDVSNANNFITFIKSSILQQFRFQSIWREINTTANGVEISHLNSQS
ncbi:CatB-related O-acetyltransferase [Helicobacter sp. 10-6591]|uniref:CatB-related O-acetyltransferase n=1 Tax=Helicobacter sp. 10-6591 TaxID=2004998 RepID=UPI0011BEDE2E|nr:CatB-related O-acetyltransferase [Helicobacter sp. 10-6591]